MRVQVVLFSYGNAQPHTLDALMREIALAKERGVGVGYRRIHDDALISRSRSKALSDFINDPAAPEVTVQIDHDIEWTPGEVVDLATRAVEKKACVAGIYSTRAKGLGIAGRLFKNISLPELGIGKDRFHEAEYLPGGFTAIPRAVAKEVCDFGRRMALVLDGEGADAAFAHALATNPGLSEAVPAGEALARFRRRVIDGALRECVYFDGSPFWPFYAPIMIPSTLKPGAFEFLSEDWAFCHRARLADPGRKQWFWSKPILAHWGSYPFIAGEAGQRGDPVKLVR